MNHTPNTPANGGQILTDERRTTLILRCLSGGIEMGWISDAEKVAIEADLRASLAAPAIEKTPLQQVADTDRLNWLTEELVDTICMDDGRIIDVGGKHANNLRAAIDTGRATPATVKTAEG